ncbi:MAG: dTDP-4-dehydrorhamnose 3,5-epimerase [Candidatus Omnitrophica bacterium]|nr:dTDP-4-dehydrorhamnose 3,5-epimerase [Candidatus Omnitrophota bacterium]
MPFHFRSAEIEGVVVVQPKYYTDERGYFAERFKASEFKEAGIDFEPKQTNFSHSERGVLRGLHFQQVPHAQAKLVDVIVGEVFDVAVDMRKGSPTYGRWSGHILSAENQKMMFIPEGFAHGFCVLSPTADVIYHCNREYTPNSEGGIRFDDSDINIQWPVRNPFVSAKDQKLPFLADIDSCFSYGIRAEGARERRVWMSR